jgi:hypothetical protein
MSETTYFTIGTEVSCSDGLCGKLTRVVIDPVARTLTHLVVEPGHQGGAGRLVPIDLVDSDSGPIRLRCTIAQFAALEDAEETQFLPGAGAEWGYGQQQMLSWPYWRAERTSSTSSSPRTRCATCRRSTSTTRRKEEARRARHLPASRTTAHRPTAATAPDGLP